jgi:hypothetical protein
VAAVVGYAFSQRAVFLLVPVFATLASIAVLSIPGEAIDLDRARDLDRAPGAAVDGSRMRSIVKKTGLASRRRVSGPGFDPWPHLGEPA